jgi:periplasmic divalent cation tolerance protein
VSAMQMSGDDLAVVYATFPTVEEAERIGGTLVDRGLAACVNLLPVMTSIYVWQGKTQRDSECAMLIKTRKHLADRVIDEVRTMHSYETPALLVLDVTGGSEAFCRWIGEQTANPR